MKILRKKVFPRVLGSKTKIGLNRYFSSAEMNPKPVDNLAFKNLSIPSVTIIRTVDQARKAIDVLKSAQNRFHAWDTETLNIDPKEQSPVTHGRIICFSCFAGPDVDFGNGPRLFIDNYAESNGIVNEFKNYFEDSEYLKVFHNYGFDRHIFYNHGINVKGFGGDTLHMARMYDTSKLPNEFSLQKLSEIYHDELIRIRKFYLHHFRTVYSTNPQILDMFKVYENFNEGALKKIDMKKLFQYRKILANGEEGKSLIMPEIEELHTNPKFIKNWITYSVLDAEVTYYLRDLFQRFLESLSTKTKTHKNPIGDRFSNNYELYLNYWRPFGELMTDMEREGIKIDVAYLKNIQESAERDYKECEMDFIRWVRSIQPDALEFNPGSTQQLQQLLFAPCYRKLSLEQAGKLKIKKTKEEEDEVESSESNPEVSEDSDESIEEGIERGNSNRNTNGRSDKKNSNNKSNSSQEIMVLPPERTFKVENVYRIIKEGRTTPLKHRDMTIKGLGFKPLGFTEGGLPAIDQHIVKKMLVKEENGKSYAYNRFMEKFRKESQAEQFEKALKSYEKLKHIETLLKTFIIPLQDAADKNGRIHCSLNFNTDTGRISARRPNLQNQPAHDKDIYKIRKAFQAEKGNKLIVADYGQLELRILANITECKSMIEAFKLGGDFHSRTALVRMTDKIYIIL